MPLGALVALACALAAVAGAPARALRAGAAVAAIELGAGTPLAGWPERGADAVADGVREALEARALVLEGEEGRPRVALVAADTFAAWPGLRAAVAASSTDLALDALLVVATGTRSGPDGRRPEVLRAIAGACARALREASSSLEPALLGTGEARAPGLSRLAVGAGGVVDERVPVLRIDASEGGAIATVFSFGAQPAVLSAANRRLSPDYPRHARRRLEAVHGGVALWLPGAPASQLPNYGGLERRRGDVDFEVEAATALGNALGLVVAAALPTLPMVDAAPLAAESARVPLPANETVVALRAGGLRALFVPVAASAELADDLRARSRRDAVLVSNAGASLGDAFASAEQTAVAPAPSGPRLDPGATDALLAVGARLLQALP